MPAAMAFMTSKSQSSPDEPVVILGSQSASGAYLLHISVYKDLVLPFGRFKSGKAVDVPAGDYLYIGSAMGGRLFSRLLRHAIRTSGKPPQTIRTSLIRCIAYMGLTIPHIGVKHLHWHIDYLVDSEVVELACIIAIRSDARLEHSLVSQVEQLPGVQFIQQGLGASDSRGHTHLLRLNSPALWNETRDTVCRILEKLCLINDR
jgi:Uri superfamily endonuclease